MLFTMFSLSFIGLFFGMALVKYGNGVAAISGKIAGNVFFRNKVGACIRAWAKPTSTPTISQTVQRARFGNQSALWGHITSAQREAWQGAAAPLQRTNRLGDPYVPTGRQLFLEANNNIAVIAQTALSNPPGDFTPPTIDPAIVVLVTQVAGVITTVDGDTFNDDANVYTTVEATAPLQFNKTNLTNVYRLIGKTTADAAPDLLAMYTAFYGTAAVSGQVIWFRLKTVSKVNGMASAPVIVLAKFA